MPRQYKTMPQQCKTMPQQLKIMLIIILIYLQTYYLNVVVLLSQSLQASIILWDYTTKTVDTKWDLHKVKVQSLAFSKSGKYVISLGGQDDGS